MNKTDTDKTKTAFYLETGLLNKLKIRSAIDRQSMSQIANNLIEEYLVKKGDI